jgi:protocatechuate 3,4-dioxygenase beta subunit
MRKLCLTLLLFHYVTSFAAPQGPNDPGEPGEIIGVVINSDGHPVVNARIYVRENNRPQIGAIRYVTTGRNGEFRVVNLRPGDYDIFAVPSQSTSMITRWTKRVHLPENRPIAKVTIRVGSVNWKN